MSLIKAEKVGKYISLTAMVDRCIKCFLVQEKEWSWIISGVSGVSYYPPRKKYRARIKISQLDIHLGYYDTFQEAVQARDVGMECMFGEYGRYNNVPAAPIWIRSKVIEKCKRFAELSVCRAFLLSCDKAENNLEVTNE